MKRYRVYRETVNRLLRENGLKADDLSVTMGHGRNYIAVSFNKGYWDMSEDKLTLLALASGIDKEAFKEIPMTELGRRKAEEVKTQSAITDGETRAMISALNATMIDGFRMLHHDIKALIETMDKYWKPTEPMPTIDRGQGEEHDG